MKFVVIGESAGASREAIMAVYPRHKQLVDKFCTRSCPGDRSIWRWRKHGNIQDARSSRGIFKTGSVCLRGIGQELRHTAMVGFATSGVNIVAIAMVKYAVQQRNPEEGIEHLHATNPEADAQEHRNCMHPYI